MSMKDRKIEFICLLKTEESVNSLISTQLNKLEITILYKILVNPVVNETLFTRRFKSIRMFSNLYKLNIFAMIQRNVSGNILMQF